MVTVPGGPGVVLSFIMMGDAVREADEHGK